MEQERGKEWERGGGERGREMGREGEGKGERGGSLDESFLFFKSGWENE